MQVVVGARRVYRTIAISVPFAADAIAWLAERCLFVCCGLIIAINCSSMITIQVWISKFQASGSAMKKNLLANLEP